MVDYLSVISTLFAALTALVFSFYSFYSYFKKNIKTRLFLGLFLLSAFFVYFFATFRLYIVDDLFFENFLFKISSLSGLLVVVFYLLLVFELMVDDKNVVYYNLGALILLFLTTLSLLFLPATRVQTSRGSEWIPNIISRGFLAIIAFFLIFIGFRFILIGLNTGLKKSLLFGTGTIFGTIGLALDALGSEFIVFNRFLNSIGAILMFFSIIFSKK